MAAFLFDHKSAVIHSASMITARLAAPYFIILITTACLGIDGETAAAGSPIGTGYQWPSYNPNLDYNFRKALPELEPPTKVLDDVQGVVGTVTSGWWCFRYGKQANSLVTERAWTPMLDYMNAESAYFRDVMGWPVDKRALHGYYSTIYLFGSGLSTDHAQKHRARRLDGQRFLPRRGVANGPGLLLPGLCF